MKYSAERVVWGLLRIAMGWVFLWGFLDKVFGLGFSTAPEQAWLMGGSPTTGFLSFATKGPFAEIFKSMAGNVLVDWLFMIGLFCIGVSLILGIGVRIAGYSGALMLILMYLAGFIPPEHNPIVDEHIVNALVMLGLTAVPSGEYLGFGKWWAKQGLVRKYSIFR